MAQVRLKMDTYDVDMAQVYAPFDYKKARYICCCSMHIDSVDLVFGPKVASRLQDWGEMDVDVDVFPLLEDE